MEKFCCLACGGSSSTQTLADCPDYYLGTPYRVDFWECADCKLVQQHPVPRDTTAFYADYPVHTKKGLLFRWFRRLLMASSYFPVRAEHAHKRLLDFGCGDGWFLESCKSKRLDVAGFERDPVHAWNLASELGVPVHSDLGDLLREEHARFDIVTMNFVVEHVTDLHATFDLAAHLLKPGGLFYFSVPAYDALEHKIFGKNWHSLDAPRHISFPGPTVIASLAGQHGFALSQTRRLPFPTDFAASLAVAIAGKFKYPIFLACLPVSLIFNLFFRTSAYGYWLRRQ